MCTIYDGEGGVFVTSFYDYTSADYYCDTHSGEFVNECFIEDYQYPYSPDSAGVQYQIFKVYKFYNGMGQLIQTQNQATLQDGECSAMIDSYPDQCNVIVDYVYDSNGRMIRQYVPYAISEPVSVAYVPIANRGDGVNLYTSTEYDSVRSDLAYHITGWKPGQDSLSGSNTD